jgi:Flp pilus assembly pilin Flp
MTTARIREGVKTHMWNDLKSYLQGLTMALVRGEEGQGLVEYSLILALVSIATIVALGALAGGINGVLGEVTGAL